MGSEVVCPHCGGLVPVAEQSPMLVGSSASGSGTGEAEFGSADWLDPVRFSPDPALGQPSTPTDPREAEDWGSGADLVAAPSPDLDPAPEGPSGTAPAFTLDLGPGRPKPPEPVGPSAETEPRARPPWPSVLLASYASAATLALIYVVAIAPRRAPGPPSLPADSRGGGAVAPIARERATRLGEPLRIGLLEWTPTEVRAGRVPLSRADGRGHDEGEPGSLILTVRLRNLSTAEAFAPLDPAFVRRPDRGAPDSLILDDDAQAPPIEPYPLAPAQRAGDRRPALRPPEAGRGARADPGQRARRRRPPGGPLDVAAPPAGRPGADGGRRRPVRAGGGPLRGATQAGPESSSLP